MEFSGEVYPMKILAEDEEKINYQTELVLSNDVKVKGLTFLRAEETLLLDLDGLGKSIKLEKFARLMERKANEFAEVNLTADLSHLSDGQREMLKLLFQVADIMEEIYWSQVFPDKDAAMAAMVDENVARFFEINYGPWERLNGNLPFLPGYGPKPAGSGYYPADMSREEFEALDDPRKTSLYTLITRNQEGNLQVVPYHEAYQEQVGEAAGLLKQASELAEDPGFRKYLQLRAEALLTDDYLASDMAWMDMKDNDIDFVAGPIENYEDALYNYKAAHESFILIKDKEWSKKLAYINSVHTKARCPEASQTWELTMPFIIQVIAMPEAKPLPSTCPTMSGCMPTKGPESFN